MHLFWLTCIVAVLECVAGNKNVNDSLFFGAKSRRIDSNGMYAPIEDVPYQVWMTYALPNTDMSQSYGCGGVIISPTVILTAAHCVQGVITSYRIRAGSMLRGFGGVYRTVDDYYIHDKYRQNFFDFDIAILILNENLHFSNTIQPAQLPDEFNDIPMYEWAVISGFGRYEKNNNNSSHFLRKGYTRVVDESTCEAGLLQPHPPVTKNMICVGNTDGDFALPCKGDSGGALAKNGTVYGIASWVPDNTCSTRTSAVYTRVSAFRKWIKDKVNI